VNRDLAHRGSAHRDLARRDKSHRDVARRDSPLRDIATSEIMHGGFVAAPLRRVEAGGRVLSTIVFGPGPRVPEHGEGGKDAADVVLGGGALADGMSHVGMSHVGMADAD